MSTYVTIIDPDDEYTDDDRRRDLAFAKRQLQKPHNEAYRQHLEWLIKELEEELGDDQPT